jgi:hypothetical protein
MSKERFQLLTGPLVGSAVDSSSVRPEKPVVKCGGLSVLR